MTGFMYLSVIIDVSSHYTVGWHLSDVLEKEYQTELLRRAILMHGTPEIINSVQGAQCTCPHWIDVLTALGIAIRMDGWVGQHTISILNTGSEPLNSVICT